MMKSFLSNGVVGLAMGIVSWMPMTVAAQNFPAQRIELIVPNPPGGGTDTVGRAVAEAVQKYLHQSVIVVNRPGASGSIGLTEAANAKPDGYKLGVMIPEVTWLASLGIGKVSNEDFVPLAQFTQDPASITVRSDARWNTVEEFLAEARSKPGGLTIANSGNGGSWHLAAAALEEKADVKFLHVPYQGSAPAFMALLAGQVDATTVAPGEMTSHIAAGKLKVLAVMAEQRLADLNTVPTLKERGVDLVVNIRRGIAAPKGTPNEVVTVLRTALREAGADDSLRASISAQHMNYQYADGPEFQTFLQEDAERFQPLVKRLSLND